MLESLVPMFISLETSDYLLRFWQVWDSLFLLSSLTAHFPPSPPFALFPPPPRDSQMRKARSLPGIKSDGAVSSGYVPIEQVRGRRADVENKEIAVSCC